MDGAISYIEIGRWLKERNFSVPRRFDSRDGLFQHIAQNVDNNRVLYLEFGVFQGASMRLWSTLLSHPDCHLHGFDSFEGLPEDWKPDHKLGHFSTEGNIPVIDDPRVSFSKGWIKDTLPDYELPEHDILVLNMDLDLYSATKTALSALQDFIRPGTYIYFDEIYDRNHEMKAFDEFLSSSGGVYECVGSDRIFTCAAFKRTA